MREYGQIQCAFWQSEDALSFTDAGKLLAAYLMTGPHSNGVGCYLCPDGYVMEDLGWSSERVSEGFAELSRKGWAYRFERVVCMPKFLFWNRVSNGNVAKARVGELLALPKGQAKALAAAGMLEFCAFLTEDDRALLETVAQTLSKGYANQNPTQPHPDPTQPNLSSTALAPSTDGEAQGQGKTVSLDKHRAEREAVRLAQVTTEAIAAFNSILGKPNGLLPKVAKVGTERRRKDVKRCLKVASEICQEQYGNPKITPEFWESYFGECAEDPFKSGRQAPGKGHENWTPSFEYLTREDVMLAVFDKAAAA